MDENRPVSYTHLDVYKRQIIYINSAARHLLGVWQFLICRVPVAPSISEIGSRIYEVGICIEIDASKDKPIRSLQDIQDKIPNSFLVKRCV